MSDLSRNCPRKILGNICTEKTEYIYIAIEKCSERCEFIRKKKRKLAKAEKGENNMKQQKLYTKKEKL